MIERPCSPSRAARLAARAPRRLTPLPRVCGFAAHRADKASREQPAGNYLCTQDNHSLNPWKFLRGGDWSGDKKLMKNESATSRGFWTAVNGSDVLGRKPRERRTDHSDYTSKGHGYWVRLPSDKEPTRDPARVEGKKGKQPTTTMWLNRTYFDMRNDTERTEVIRRLSHPCMAEVRCPSTAWPPAASRRDTYVCPSCRLRRVCAGCQMCSTCRKGSVRTPSLTR